MSILNFLDRLETREKRDEARIAELNIVRFILRRNRSIRFVSRFSVSAIQAVRTVSPSLSCACRAIRYWKDRSIPLSGGSSLKRISPGAREMAANQTIAPNAEW